MIHLLSQSNEYLNHVVIDEYEYQQIDEEYERNADAFNVYHDVDDDDDNEDDDDDDVGFEYDLAEYDGNEADGDDPTIHNRGNDRSRRHGESNSRRDGEQRRYKE